jgi:hypothetical protein
MPVKVRADRRRGITDDGTVRLVTIRGRQESVPRPRRDTDGTGPTRRYDRGRWMVQEHTRDHCMNPALHRDGGAPTRTSPSWTIRRARPTSRS